MTTSTTSTQPAFTDLGLPTDLLEAVTDLGFTIPTEIQAAAIPVLLSGRDVVGIAQTGTGKTAAYALPLLAAIDPDYRGVQSLVLAPTRELALQVADAITTFAAHTDVDVLAVYGGSSYVPQLRGLERGAQVVVGTPGRVMDLIERGALVLDDVRFFVLDEADEMLRMGFAEDVETIASNVPSERRTALFSATMPADIARVAATHLHDPVRVAVTRPASTTTTVHQTYAIVPFRNKATALTRVLAVSDADAALVFVRTKSMAEEVATELAAGGIAAAALSGDVPQRERERIVERLRAGTVDVLVATDVAARGLDVERIGLVVNFDVPREIDTYVHRIGRTGRAGRTGVALTFLTPRERTRLSQIERRTGAKLEEIAIPTAAQVAAHGAAKALAQVADVSEGSDLDLYREAVADHLESTGLSAEELAAALLAAVVGAPTADEDLVVAAPELARRPSRTGGGSGARYRIEVGHRDGVQPGAIVGAITGEGGLRGSDLGKIDIFPSFSLVEITGELSDEASRRIGAAKVAGRALRIRPDTGPSRGAGASSGRRHAPHAEHRAERGDYDRGPRRVRAGR